MRHTTCPAHPEAPLRPAVVTAADRFWGFGGRFTYGRCPECGSWVLDPRPEPAEMGPYYAGYYPEAELDWRRKAWARWKPRQALGVDAMRALDAQKRLRRLGLSWTPETKVLDAGCGAGGFLAALREETGAVVRGVDFDPRCCDFAQTVYAVPADAGEVADQGYAEGAFDVVTSWHCLEHTYDPLAELVELRRITRPSGWLMMEIPTVSPLAWLFRGRWFFLQAPTHLYHLRRPAFTALLERAGWSVVQLKRVWLPTELAGSLLMLFGVKRFAPGILFGKGAAAFTLRIVFGLLMLVDLPITFLLALFGQTGGLRVVARRPEEGP